jgi:hypothetical protein
MKRRPPVSNLTGGVVVLVVGLVALAIGYISAGQDHSTPVDADPVRPASTRGVVQSVTADSLTVTTDGGARSFRLTPSTQTEALRPATVSAIREGDWINGGALPHAQTLFALTGLVLLPRGSFTPPQ